MDKRVLIAGIILIAIFSITALSLRLFKPEEITPQDVNTSQNYSNPAEADISAIRSFMDQPNLELTFVNTDLPMPYFRVGKVTKVGNGENMEKVDSWVRQVNVYDQKELINETCSVYEYHLDTRNHKLTAVIIKGLKPSEIESYKSNGVRCSSDSGSTQILYKSEAETIAMNYLKRDLPNFDQVRNQFSYSQQNNGESHEWIWENKNFKLPNDLSSRPYPYPIVRISVYGNGVIQYWNTTSLFEK